MAPYKIDFGQGTKSILVLSGRRLNEAVSFLVFTLLELLDFILCFLFKALDFFIEAADIKPCYCSSPKDAITNRTGGTGKVLVYEMGESTPKIFRLMTASSTKLQLEDLSDTLYTRPSLVFEFSRSTFNELRRLKVGPATTTRSMIHHQYPSCSFSTTSAAACSTTSYCNNGTVRSTTKATTLTVNSTVVEMLQAGKIETARKKSARWSDCDCRFCTSWTSSSKDTLFVQTDGAKAKEGVKGTEDVLFIHGFISSSKFWTETVFPNLSSSAKSKYRLFAVDLLGFGRSPKPIDSLYTLREHVEMIERSVLEAHQVKSLHIVAHSLGCILALALAVKHPGCIKSLTLLAPPYFGVPNKGEQATQYVMRRLAPRKVWPVIAFGASVACWYEHISRAVCLVFCKNHRMWEFLINRASRNRIKCFLLEGFLCHTHNAAWHTLHNVICGTAKKLDGYLDTVRESLKCEVTVFHGREDQLIPVECSHKVQSKIPRARLKLIDHEDHITIVVGRRKTFARELEDIWRKASATVN